MSDQDKITYVYREKLKSSFFSGKKTINCFLVKIDYANFMRSDIQVSTSFDQCDKFRKLTNENKVSIKGGDGGPCY